MTMRCIAYHSYVPTTGYGIAASRYVDVLGRDDGFRVHWIAHEFENGTSRVLSDGAGRPCANILHLTPPRMATLLRTDVPNLACTVLEADSVPASWLPVLERVNRIAVPSTWNQAVFAEALRREIDVVPHISEFHGIHPPDARTPFAIPDHLFVFLSVGSWDQRKNFEELVEAYLDAFTAEDEVLLVIKTEALSNYRKAINLFWARRRDTTRSRVAHLSRKRARPPRILLITERLAARAMQALHARADAYVTLTRGEGWGYGCFEAAWFGKPVIATGYGGYLDYLKPDLAFLVDYRLTGYRRHPWDREAFSEQRYAAPDRGDAIDKMRFVFGNRDLAAARGRRLHEFVASHFDAKVSAARLHRFVRSALEIPVPGPLANSRRATGACGPGATNGTRDRGSEKYFQEAGRASHYDYRFYRGELDRSAKIRGLLGLLGAFMQMLEPTGIRPILMHGALIGWAWNGRLLPWDKDIDLSILLDDLYALERMLSELGYDRSRYLLDINPNFTCGETRNEHRWDNNELNKIDARFIDLRTGLYLDITALRDTGDGRLVTKCPHRFRKGDVLPLRGAVFHGIAISVPNDVPAILAQEYGEKVLTRGTFRGWRFDFARGEWREKPRWELAVQSALQTARRRLARVRREWFGGRAHGSGVHSGRRRA